MFFQSRLSKKFRRSKVLTPILPLSWSRSPASQIKVLNPGWILERPYQIYKGFKNIMKITIPRQTMGITLTSTLKMLTLMLVLQILMLQLLGLSTLSPQVKERRKRLLPISLLHLLKNRGNHSIICEQRNRRHNSSNPDPLWNTTNELIK